MARGELWRLSDAAGRPPGVYGLWPSRAITFIENHDTGSTLNHWPFPHNHLHAGHAYLLTHPGTPCVFYDHWAAASATARAWGQRARPAQGARRQRADVPVESRDPQGRGERVCGDARRQDRDEDRPGDWSPGDAGIDCGQKDWLLVTSGSVERMEGEEREFFWEFRGFFSRPPALFVPAHCLSYFALSLSRILSLIKLQHGTN